MIGFRVKREECLSFKPRSYFLGLYNENDYDRSKASYRPLLFELENNLEFVGKL